MTVIQQIITIAIAAVTNFLTRVLPFQIFTKKGKDNHLSPFIDGLGKFLPPAIMGMLVVYCYRDVNVVSGSHGLPEFLAGAVTILIHLWKGSMFLSLVTGTLCYILLINFVF